MDIEISEAKRYGAVLATMISMMDYQYCVTLAFNAPRTVASARSCLSKFHARLDRELLGRNWSDEPKEKRSSFTATIEHPESNIHFHLAIKPASDLHGDFALVVERIWKRLVPSGTVRVMPISDAEGWARYITKDTGIWGNPDRWVQSEEFIRTNT